MQKSQSPATMLSGLCAEPGRFVLEERPVPEDARDGWVLVDIAAVGLCGTDYHIFAGKHPYLAYPRVIGHELSGRLVTPAVGLPAGSLVVINPYFACGNCRACQRGRPNCCESIEVLGVHRDGGLCARIEVPQCNVYSAEGLTDIQAAMVEFLAIGAHAVRRSQMDVGDKVLVVGAGPIGLGVALFARQAGAEVHLLDLSKTRLRMARQLFGLESSFEDTEMAMQGGGFDVVFDATGNLPSINAGFSLLAHASTYVLVSVVKGDIAFDDAQFHKREARLVGSRNALKADFEQVIAALRDGTIDSAALCSAVVPFAELPQRFVSLATDRERLIKAIVRV